MQFVDFVTNTANTIAFTQATGSMPVRKDAVDDPAEKAYLTKTPNAMTAIKQLSESTAPRPPAARRVHLLRPPHEDEPGVPGHLSEATPASGAGPLPEDRRPEPHAGRPALDGELEVARHAHAQGIEAAGVLVAEPALQVGQGAEAAPHDRVVG